MSKTENPLMKNRIYLAAREYLELGLPVIPICSPDHSSESLNHRQICSSPGKVPVILDWQERQSTTEAELFKWFASHPKRNIGLPMGNASRLVGIDIDGELGEKYLQELSKGDLPETWEFKTGKGRRLLYALPEGVRVKKFKRKGDVLNEKHQELALLGDGQQTVIPPSIHASGYEYRWMEGRSPFEMATPALAPQWMLHLMQRKTRKNETTDTGQDNETLSPRVTEDEWSGTVYEGSRQDRLVRLAGSLLHRGTIPKEEVLLFLKNWNERHCVPPVTDEELERMVEGLTYAEQAKNVARLNDQGREVLRPSVFVKKFIEDQKRAGFSWHYSIKNGCFYRCDDARGPWQIYDKQLVARDIRLALVDEKEDWDYQRYITEAIEALKEELANPEIDEYLDLGQCVLRRPELLNYISVANGLLDWRKLDLLPWDSSTYLTTQLPIPYDESAKCPTWLEVLEQWLPDPDVRAFLQEYIGLCLIPDTSFRTAVFLYGRGSNGKSMFIDAIARLFGDTIHFTPLHRLTERFETAYLQGKLINVCGDVDPKYLTDTGVLKAIIAGDKIRGEYKHGKSFHFTPVVRLMFSANEIPKARDKSEGWYSRWRLIEFPVRFERNPAFKIEFEEAIGRELPGMLNWAIEGLRRLKLVQRNRFTEAQCMLEAMKKYIVDNDNIAFFITERLLYEETLKEAVLSGEVIVPRGKGKGDSGTLGTFYIDKWSLYKYYKWYCGECGFKPVTVSDFSRAMKNYGFEVGPRPPRKGGLNATADNKTRTPSFLRVWIKPEFEREFNFVTCVMD